MNAVETENLCRDFKTLHAVRDLNLTVREGELYALLGVNGAGKSTLIKMLTCLLLPTSGKARVCGYDVVGERENVKRLIGISPQETAAAKRLTVRENLEFMAGIYGASRTEARTTASEFIESCSLGEAADRTVGKLSGGYQRRLSVAMALVARPKVLFLDEPTLGLDVISRRELWALVRKLKGSTTVILTTHYLEEAEALADRVGVMAHGVLLAEGTVAELTAKTHTVSLEEAFIKVVEGGGL